MPDPTTPLDVLLLPPDQQKLKIYLLQSAVPKEGTLNDLLALKSADPPGTITYDTVDGWKTDFHFVLIQGTVTMPLLDSLFKDRLIYGILVVADFPTPVFIGYETFGSTPFVQSDVGATLTFSIKILGFRA